MVRLLVALAFTFSAASACAQDYGGGYTYRYYSPSTYSSRSYYTYTPSPYPTYATPSYTAPTHRGPLYMSPQFNYGTNSSTHRYSHGGYRY